MGGDRRLVKVNHVGKTLTAGHRIVESSGRKACASLPRVRGMRRVPGGEGRSEVRTAERHRDARIMGRLIWEMAGDLTCRGDPHEFPNSVHFIRLNPDSPLSLGAPLQVAERDSLTADHKQATVRHGEPSIQARYGNPEPPRGFMSGQEFVGHKPAIKRVSRICER